MIQHRQDDLTLIKLQFLLTNLQWNVLQPEEGITIQILGGSRN